MSGFQGYLDTINEFDSFDFTWIERSQKLISGRDGAVSLPLRHGWKKKAKVCNSPIANTSYGEGKYRQCTPDNWGTFITKVFSPLSRVPTYPELHFTTHFEMQIVALHGRTKKRVKEKNNESHLNCLLQHSNNYTLAQCFGTYGPLLNFG